jgi:hypothetical protein
VVISITLEENVEPQEITVCPLCGAVKCIEDSPQ